jgi:hypothetical protein
VSGSGGSSSTAPVGLLNTLLIIVVADHSFVVGVNGAFPGPPEGYTGYSWSLNLNSGLPEFVNSAASQYDGTIYDEPVIQDTP